ncbi:gamma-glutamyl-gamma-aminobutyrate hydrolase family protein [Gordonia sp. ABSL11-1]|uniref:gamma-glutamyl-gamma-aminobutyrate hydrolase family protein n=1 Tax=Gordonia sp. ABSL11-1 TaxID=3053924 RepID=UPI0025732DA9|nr:gamma-glutamyl-gamma-aminobutyrate hydrolase family protein [Gordonia sp. ABSL11-1]MDL9944349.1 gamma-glutamyl-gamma-aminobutyrate hydrolase family protein [Gordonia sp. ABSL11-1]
MNDSERAATIRPVVGLTTYLEQSRTGVWDVRASFLPHVYFDGIGRAGGIAVLLPPQPADREIADRVVDGLDALVLTGGVDVDPAGYGQDRHPETDSPRTDRDRWEFALLEAALRRHVPVLGICRGIQVLNVALGGTLHQHLPDVVGHSRHRAGNAVFSSTQIDITPGTRLASMLGESVETQCYHHQAIDRPAESLVVSARDSDHLIEAVEIPGDDFVVAVQWHPEERLDDLRLFSAVVDAARVRLARSQKVEV